MTSDQDGWRRWALRFGMAGVAGLAIVLAACENNSDPVAPADSTITVSANPQTVVVPSGGQGSAEITATVRSKNGTRVPDQEIIFSTSAGTLDPPAETPLETDDNGQATSVLITSTSATITARSGSIMGTTQVNTAPGDLSQFLLNLSPDFLSTCNDMITLTATVVTTTGDPVPAVIVIFEEVPGGNLTGSFSPGSQVLTDSNGEARVTWTPLASVCASQCQSATGDPNNPLGRGTCEVFFVATDTTRSFESFEEELLDNVP